MCQQVSQLKHFTQLLQQPKPAPGGLPHFIGLSDEISKLLISVSNTAVAHNLFPIKFIWLKKTLSVPSFEYSVPVGSFLGNVQFTGRGQKFRSNSSSLVWNPLVSYSSTCISGRKQLFSWCFFAIFSVRVYFSTLHVLVLKSFYFTS